MNVALNELVSNECGLKWMWSQMKRSQMNVVSNAWSQMNCLKWMVSNELVSIVMEPYLPVQI